MSDSHQAPDPDADADDRGTQMRKVSDAFVEQLRNGEAPSIEDYKRKYPELAAEISEVLPVLELLEQAQPGEPAQQPFIASANEPVPDQFGEYRIVQEIGRGGMGIVYEAEHETMRRRVALKVLPQQTAADTQRLNRFHREARAAGQLHHTNIVPVFEVGEFNGMHYYAMQFIRGQNLDVVLEDLRAMQNETQSASSGALPYRSSGELHPLIRAIGLDSSTEAQQTSEPAGVNFPAKGRQTSTDDTGTSIVPSLQSFEWPRTANSQHYYRRVAAVGVQVADALEHAHLNGVLHRDIKPSNLILDTEGTVWVTDFGLAKHEDDQLTQTGDIVGTLRYMAPERYQGSADARSDIYGLGLTLYELCTFRHAHESADRAQLVQQVTQRDPTPPRKIDSSIPRDLETIVLKAIDRQPERRYQTAHQIAEDLRLFLSDRPIQARRISAMERFWRICRRNPGTALIATCLAAALALIAIGSTWFAIESRDQADKMAAETRRAQGAEQVALEANRKSRQSIYDLNVGQAEMRRRSRRPGQHFGALASIRQAIELTPELNFTPERMAAETVKLRNEAIAAMAVADVQIRWIGVIDETWTESVCFDARHERYAQADRSGNVRVRSVNDSTPEILLSGPQQRAWQIRFSRDGRYLFALFHPGSQPEQAVARVWDLQNPAEPVLEIDEGLPQVEDNFDGVDFALAPNGDLLALCTDVPSVVVYALDEGGRFAELPIEYETQHIQFSHDGTQLAVAQTDGSRLEIWRLDDEPAVLQSREVDGSITSLDWHSERSILAVGTRVGEIHLWRDGLDTEPEQYSPHRNIISRLYLDPSGDLLFSDSWDRTCRLTYIAGQFEQLHIESHDLLPPGFSEDGSRVAFRRPEPNEDFGLWQLPKRALTVLASRVDGGVKGPRVRFHPHHAYLAARSTNEQIELWDVRRPIRLKTIPLKDSPWIRFSPDGTSLLTSGETGLRRWPIEVVESQSTLEVSAGAPVTLVGTGTKDFDVTRSGRAVAVIVPGDRSQLVHAQNGAVITQCGRHPKVNRVLVSPDERWVVTSTWDGSGVFVWDAQSGELAQKLEPSWFTAQVTINPQTSEAFVSQWEGSRFWTLDPWQWRPSEAASRERLAGFSPSGRLLAMGFTAYTPQLAHPQTASMLACLESPSLIASGDYEFSHDDSLLAIASSGRPHIWNLDLLRRGLADLQLDWEVPHLPVDTLVVEDSE